MLLYQMLPRSVGKLLKQNKAISAETYQSVTIFFSDIVGFSELVAESTPMQVLFLLNALYRMYDSRIEQYEVYKIETICDTLITNSGLTDQDKETQRHSGNLERMIFTTPCYKLMSVKNDGKGNAAEVATMALDLLHATENFVVPHMHGERLQIRIGIHTGPVVAGVVGIKMPRYTLFGETASIASKMESTGLPFKIHVTAATKEALDKAGEFIIKRRGEIEMKQMTSMSTFWLIGKHGCLPDRTTEREPNETINIMANNPHTDALRKQRQKNKQAEKSKPLSQAAVRAVDTIRMHMNK